MCIKHVFGDCMAAGALQAGNPQPPEQPIKMEGAFPKPGVFSPYLNVLCV